ncbi:hypothetical protein DFH06DRAFT_1150225 [Mycena polygramma]|nr:hypothetical protein DFH06DRAFT_1150225 [Mycena polygramma]
MCSVNGLPGYNDSEGKMLQPGVNDKNTVLQRYLHYTQLDRVPVDPKPRRPVEDSLCKNVQEFCVQPEWPLRHFSEGVIAFELIGDFSPSIVERSSRGGQVLCQLMLSQRCVSFSFRFLSLIDNDVVVLIFPDATHIPSRNRITPLDILDIPERRFTVQMVSRSWFTTVRSEPSLWAIIYHDNDSSLGALQESLLLSGTLPLTIHIELHPFGMIHRPRMGRPDVGATLHTITHALQPHVMRCATLILESHDRSGTAALLSGIRHLPFPLLGKLVLKLFQSMQHGAPIHSDPLIQLPLPRLARMEVSGGFTGVSSAAIFSSITHLHLHALSGVSWQGYSAALAAAQNITHFYLVDTDCETFLSVTDAASYAAVRLAGVTDVFVRSSDSRTAVLLSRFLFPNLTKLHLDLPCVHAYRQFFVFPQTLLSAVVDLVLVLPPLHSVNWSSLLAQLPRLDRLDISQSAYAPVSNYDFFERGPVLSVLVLPHWVDGALVTQIVSGHKVSCVSVPVASDRFTLVYVDHSRDVRSGSGRNLFFFESVDTSDLFTF